MAHRVTNELLGQLLQSLGFERLHVTEKNHRIWRHRGSGCILFLPDNKKTEPARLIDLADFRTHLHHRGHLDEKAFDQFVAEGKLPVLSSA